MYAFSSKVLAVLKAIEYHRSNYEVTDSVTSTPTDKKLYNHQKMLLYFLKKIKSFQMELNACWSNFVAFNIIINALIDWIIKNCQENSVIFLKVKSF